MALGALWPVTGCILQIGVHLKQRWMDAYSQYMECHVSEWTNNVQIQRNLWGSHGGYVETSQLTPSFSLKSTRDEVDINKRKSRLPTKLRITRESPHAESAGSAEVNSLPAFDCCDVSLWLHSFLFGRRSVLLVISPCRSIDYFSVLPGKYPCSLHLPFILSRIVEGAAHCHINNVLSITPNILHNSSSLQALHTGLLLFD